MRVLITGITGLIGSHLAEYSIACGHTVYGLVRTRGNVQNLSHLRGKDKPHLIEGDAEDSEAVYAAIRSANPDVLFHLAGQSYPSVSWDAPLKTLTVNIASTIHVLETVRRYNPKTKVLIACSAAQYGLSSQGETLQGGGISEDRTLRPVHPYGISKVAQELLGYQYWVNFKIPTYLPRFFNQAGPRQGDRTALQSWARQIAQAEQDTNESNRIIKVGNLDPIRDFLDVRDGVRALWALIERGKLGEPYNVCSGKGYTMGELLNSLLALSKVPVRYAVDSSRLRILDEPIIVGDYSKLARDTGWKPQIPIEETLRSILEYWRSKLD